MSVFKRVLRSGEGRKLKFLQALVPDINALEPSTEVLSDDALKAKTPEFRTRLDNGESPNDLLFEAFAVTNTEQPHPPSGDHPDPVTPTASQ